MPSATTSGAKATPNTTGDTKHREHKQGNQERKYTIEQKTAVIRVRRCSPTAFYDILGLEETRTTVSDGDIKKAYRKLSLLTHPDKNGYDGADEAFKMVSRAFQVLSDPDKRSKYDNFGGDPDSRFGAGSASTSSPFSNHFGRSSPFGGGGGGAGGGGGGGGRPPPHFHQNPMWEDEISPEELFSRFFGGGGMGGPFGAFSTIESTSMNPSLLMTDLTNDTSDGGMFETGPQFVFNLNGGPGFRVHQFGGNVPRRRPRETTRRGPNANDDEPPPPSLLSALSNLFPLLILFLLPLLSSFFSTSSSDGSSTSSFFSSSGPSFRFDTPTPPYTLQRTTPRLNIDYYINPKDVSDWTDRKFNQLDQKAEQNYLVRLKGECDREFEYRERLIQDARGWFFFDDEQKLKQARELEMRSCRKLERLRSGRGV